MLDRSVRDCKWVTIRAIPVGRGPFRYPNRRPRSAEGPPAYCRRPALSRLSRPLVWRLFLEHRHLDAEPCRELAGGLADGVGVLPRARRVPAAAADHAVHVDRRGRG